MTVHVTSPLIKFESPSPPVPCPDIDADYPQNDVGSATNINSWQACAQLCADRSECHAWTWIKPEHSYVAIRKSCFFKNSNWKSTRQTGSSNLVSGQKHCQGMDNSLWSGNKLSWKCGHVWSDFHISNKTFCMLENGKSIQAGDFLAKYTHTETKTIQSTTTNYVFNRKN